MKSGTTAGDFTRYSKQDILYGKQATSKVPIKPLVASDRAGPKW